MPSADMQLQLEQNKYDLSAIQDNDPEHLPDLFRSIYGEHYLSDAVYDPQHYRRAHAEGSARSLVARDEAGQPVGHLATIKAAPNPGVRELGQGVVDPEHRRGGLLNRLIDTSIAQADADPSCAGLFGAALTNHVFSQRALYRAEFVDLGFEIGYVPARMMQMEAGCAEPVATVLQFRMLADQPDQVAYLPQDYAPMLHALYDQLNATRDFRLSGETLEEQVAGEDTLLDLPRFDLTRLTVQTIGVDLAERVAEMENQARRDGRTMVQVVLNLGSPAADAAVKRLRAQGFWFGALLPCWLGSDALLMQKALSEEPPFAGIQVYTEDAKALLRFIQEDAASVPGPLPRREPHRALPSPTHLPLEPAFA